MTVIAAESSSSVAEPSSSTNPASSSSGTTGIVAQRMGSMTLAVEGRMLLVGGVEWADVNVFDMQGRPVASFKQVKGSVALDMLRQGNYLVQVLSGSNSLIRRIAIK